MVEWGIEAEPSRQVVARTHIVAGEDVQTTEAAQQNVLGAPAPDPTEAGQSRYGLCVLDALEGIVKDLLGVGDAPGRRSPHDPPVPEA